MKSSSITKVFLILLVIANGCMSREEPTKSSVTLSFSTSEVLNGRINEDFNPSSILLSIRSKANELLIYDLEELPIFAFGNGYITKELELIVGQYEVEDFIVLNESNEAIYLTPKKDSEFASMVNTTLPHPFLINVSDTNYVSMEVIRADLGDPIAYGYSVFTFDIVNTLEMGLIAHYLFDSSITDNSINEIDLSPTSDTSTITYVSDRKGEPNSAIYFDGTYGTIAFGDEYETGLFNQSLPQTMSFWMKTSDSNSIPEFGGGMVRIHTLGGSRFYTSIKQSQIQLNYGASNVFPYGDLFLRDTLVSNNSWHHIVYISYGDGEHGNLFVNGVELADELTFSFSNNNSSNPNINIGGIHSDNFYIGALDDVRIYNRPLNESEVLSLFLE